MLSFMSPGGACFLPPASPPPLHPRRGEGELEYPIWFFWLGEVFLNRVAARRVCLPRLGNDAVVVNRLGLGAAAAAARRGVCKVSAANEHTRPPAAIGRAEQRSGGRIRAGACLSVASLRPTPGGASSARYPAGARPWARLSFAYFSLAKQRKVRPAAGASPAAGNKPAASQNLTFHSGIADRHIATSLALRFFPQFS